MSGYQVVRYVICVGIWHRHILKLYTLILKLVLHRLSAVAMPLPYLLLRLCYAYVCLQMYATKPDQ